MAHRWRFFRGGGFDQARIETAADIAHLPELDPKLWVALSCPAQGLEFPVHTLALLDDDQDGRIRVPEVLKAATWSVSLLKNPDDLVRGGSALPLEAIRTETEEGKHILASAKQVLANLGKPDARSISPEDVADTKQVLAKTLFNGDGVLPPEAAGADSETAQALLDIQSVMGSVKDVSGLDGVDDARLVQFFRDAETYVSWARQAEPGLDREAFEAFRGLRTKADDYFTRCALAVMDGRAIAPLNPAEATYAALAAGELSPESEALRQLPLARIAPDMPLPLREGLNPAWADAVARFRDQCVTPLLGARSELSVSDWRRLCNRLAEAEAWYEIKPSVGAEVLGLARLRELVQPKVRSAIEALMAKDTALGPELKAVTAVNALTHYFRDLGRFLNNFVAFKDFYAGGRKAIFQAGTLYLDARSCDLCIRVEDVDRHASLAQLSLLYLAYCDLTRKGSEAKMKIVAAFTDGDSDFLRVGRNGLFFDRQGRDWDATIVKVIEQPISVRQAFWAPYKKIASFVEEQVNRFAGGKQKENAAALTELAGHAGTPPAAPPGPAAAAFDISKFAGIFAAVGLAVGMVGSAVAAIFTGFLGLKIWQMPLVLAGAALVVSGPSMLIAAMKLRKRNLGPVLDASGWAINARAKISISFGKSLTQMAVLPRGSERTRKDPFAHRRWPWWGSVALMGLVGVLIWLAAKGVLGRWLLALQRAH